MQTIPRMICTASISRASIAELHCNPAWAMFVNAWRAYELPDADGELLLYMQTATTMQHLRNRFPALPRLHISSMDRMLMFLLDCPGLYGLCAFSGGHFARALRRVNADLHGRFDQVADDAPRAPPASPVRLPAAHEVVDLSIEPDTPALLSRSPALSPA